MSTWPPSCADRRSAADLTEEWVADFVWSLNSPEYYLVVASRGTTPEEYAALLADVWTRTLLVAR